MCQRMPGKGPGDGRGQDVVMPFEMISGSQAAAIAVQRAGVDLVAAYPITPQTAIVETLANFAAEGILGGEFVSLESEYAALACCNGASAAGSRVFTATSSHGLAYMHEMIHWCSGARFPIVMVNVNRTIGAPWCLDPDQGDSLSQRDTGWMQIYCSGAQEVFDTVLQAFALSEELLLPCMVVFDGFYISHTYEAVDIPEKEVVSRFIGPPEFQAQVKPGFPGNLHGLSTGEMQLKLVKMRHADMLRALTLFTDINKRFHDVFGRSYKFIEAVIPPAAKTVILAAGAVSETVRWALPELKDTGLIELRMFRPFPTEQICSLLEAHDVEKVVVIDRNCSVGVGGIFAQELRAAVYGMNRPPAVYDLILAGGVDLTVQMLENMLESGLSENRVGHKWGDDMQ
jgi:pyruvate/2-oxoacid:ferredoxin oxidoreductase alpha subunit